MSKKPEAPDLGPKRNRRALKAATLDQVNQGILKVAQESFNEEQDWEFFCECGREDCNECVSLTLDAYIALHDGGGPVLADGHRLSQVERSRRLREDAETLMRQAKHQIKRARRSLRRHRATSGRSRSE